MYDPTQGHNVTTIYPYEKDYDNYELIIEKAKYLVAKAYSQNNPEEQLRFRKWVFARAKCAYNGWPNGEYDMELIMFNGSPPKGHIVINYGRGWISAFDAWNKHLKTWRLRPKG